MNILINLISIKAGGGQKVALNFAEQSFKNSYNHTVYYAVTEGTLLSDYFRKSKIENVIFVRGSLLARLWFHYVASSFLVRRKRIDIIYTLFGISINTTKAISVVGSAYSNIYYQNEGFWPKRNPLKYISFKIRDYYRLSSTLGADAIVFENEEIMHQARKVFAVRHDRSIFIKPSFSNSDVPTQVETLSILDDDQDYSGLMLTGFHFNKNIEIIPDVLREINHLDRSNNHRILISLDANDVRLESIIERAVELGVERQIKFVGTFQPNQLSQLFNKIDYVLLLSGMESFSNNIIEAWVYKKPLIISNKKWAKSICKEAALFVERNDPLNIAAQIIRLKNDSGLEQLLLKSGNRELESYPSPFEKVKKQYEFLERMYEQIK